jgi:glycosyltransferase involved in cell wall biosynthesis
MPQTMPPEDRNERRGGPIRVLYVSPVAERGGAEVTLLNILKYHDRRFFVPMACLLKDGPLVQEVRSLDVRTAVLPTKRLREIAVTVPVILEVRRLLQNENVNIVFSNMAMGHLYGGLAAMGTSVKRVWFQHTIPSYRSLDCLAARVPAERLYVNSEASLTAMRRLRPRSESIEVLYPGTETLSAAIGEGRSSLKLELGLPESTAVVAMVGRFQRGKGQHLFIELAAEVCQKRPDVCFVLVGDTTLGLEPDYKGELIKLVAHYGLSRFVKFVGWRNDVPDLLKDVDVLVHPATAPESFGLVVLEAFSQGKPVVVSCQGGLPEIVANEETGFLVPPGNVAAFTEKVLLLLGDESLRSRMGERGRQLVHRRYTMQRMISDLERGYSEMVGTGTLGDRSAF